MELKPGVQVGGVKSEILLAIWVAEKVFAEQGTTLVITALLNGEHMPESKHYEGLGVDLRSKALPRKHVAVSEIRRRLGPDYDVILENEDKEQEHIHIEFDPK